MVNCAGMDSNFALHKFETSLPAFCSPCRDAQLPGYESKGWPPADGGTVITTNFLFALSFSYMVTPPHMAVCSTVVGDD